MPEGRTYGWLGDDWQEYCDQLFALRHPNSYARMPDADRGDLGVEGYSTDGTGCAYQCYVSEAEETAKRAAAQKRKIRRDLKKLCDRAADVERHLGDIKIKRWILVVPLHDSKDVTAYARLKEKEIRSAGLTFLDPDFRIDIQTHLTHFPVERRALEEGGAGVVVAPQSSVTSKDVQELAEAEPHLLKNLEEKIARLLADRSVEDRRRFRDEMLQRAVAAANIQDYLRVHHAPVFERYLAEHDAEERDVTLEVGVGVADRPAFVADVRRRFEERLGANIRALGSREANQLSHGAVADWLRHCPIDVPMNQGQSS